MTNTNAVPARERGILFNGAMVRALLAGTKTQTRRAINPQPPAIGANGGAFREVVPSLLPNDGSLFDFRYALDNPIAVRCPFGQVGDRLWVREAWKAHTTFDHLPPCDIPESHVWYMADEGYKAQSRYRHGMFMPRWASRITLEITGVRVERLQDGDGETSAESRYLSEGINRIDHGRGDHYYSAFRNEPHPKNWCDPTDAFREVWESTGGDWDANPWVWVVEFSVRDTTTTSKGMAHG